MAFSKGKVSTGDQSNYSKIVGFSNVNIVALNPNKAQIKELTGKELENEPQYLIERETEDGRKYKSMRFDFYVKPTDLDEPLNRVYTLSLFVDNRAFINKAGDKAQVIDKYGRTKWLEKSVIEEHSPIERLDSSYRLSKRGEEEFIKLLRTFLAIENPEKYVTKSDGTQEWVLKTKEELSLCESELSVQDWEKIFNGDVSLIREIIELQPNNKVKVLFYVRVTPEGVLYQGINTKEFLLANAKESTFVKVAQRISENQKLGYGANDIYEFSGAHEFVIAPTVSAETSTNEVDDVPFADSSNDLPNW